MTKILILLIIQHIFITLSQLINFNNTILSQNTTIPTQSTTRRRLDCNYGIYYGADFYETYSINTCYQIRTYSHQYNCINSTLYELNYGSNNVCSGTISAVQSGIPPNYCYNDINTNNKCNKPIMVTQYNKNTTSFTCDKSFFISQIPFITDYCIQTPNNDNRLTGAIYNEYNPKQLSLIQYEYNTMEQCITHNIPKNIIPIITNEYDCSDMFYYIIETTPTVTTLPTTTPSTEPTIEPTSTTITPIIRREMPCNYAVDTRPNIFPFYVTYPINQCYVTPYSLSQIYTCNSNDLNSIKKFEWYNNNNCNITQQSDNTAVLTYPQDNYLPRCDIDDGTNTCEFKLIQQYDASLDNNCSKYDANSFRQSAPWILNYCIWVEYNELQEIHTYIYNQYDALQSTIIQYGYITMDDCINDIESIWYFTVETYTCQGSYYYEIQSQTISSSTTNAPTTEPTSEPTTEPTTEPTIEPTIPITLGNITTPMPSIILGNISTYTSTPSNEPTTEPTGEPTMEPTLSPTDAGRRKEIKCNYGIYNEGLFFETIPMDNCYIIPYNSGKIVKKYMCNDNGNILAYDGNDCSNKSIGNWNIDDSINGQCNIDIGNNNQCEFKLIYRYHREKQPNTCNKNGTNSFNDSIALIINYCIPVDSNGTVVYNIFQNISIVQYIYKNMSDCINNNLYSSIIVNPYKCESKWYYEIETPMITTLNPTSEPTIEPTMEPTMSPTNENIKPLDCDYGIRMPEKTDEQKYYETLIVNKCYNEYSSNGISVFNSMDRICVNGSLIDRYYTGELCMGNIVVEQPTYGNVTAYCNQQITQCDYILLREYNTCEITDRFKTYGFIIDICILFQNNMYIKNIFDSGVFMQNSYYTYDDCNNNINENIQLIIADNECKNNNTFKVIVPGVLTTQAPHVNITTIPPVVNTTNILTTGSPTNILTTGSPTRPVLLEGELNCNYGTALPFGDDAIYFETFVTNKCYARYDEYESRKFQCVNGIMYLLIYMGETCSYELIGNYTVRNTRPYAGNVEEHCNYNNEDNISPDACNFVWLKQYDARSGCKPVELHKTMAFIEQECISFEKGSYFVRNDIYRNGDDISITQNIYDTYDECVSGESSVMFYEIKNNDCPQSFAYWHHIMEVQLTTTQPTSQPTSPQPTISNIYELDCNYGVNYTERSESENDFYATYILDECYDLNVKAFDIPFALKYECDFVYNEINEYVYKNDAGSCIDDINHTTTNILTTNRCDTNKIGKQCNYVWLSSFRQHSNECQPHPHTIIKYGMIIDQCILYENHRSNFDQTAFKNIYTQTGDNRRQIIQFQYLTMSDCI
eukprot:201855_1